MTVIYAEDWSGSYNEFFRPLDEREARRRHEAIAREQERAFRDPDIMTEWKTKEQNKKATVLVKKLRKLQVSAFGMDGDRRVWQVMLAQRAITATFFDEGGGFIAIYCFNYIGSGDVYLTQAFLSGFEKTADVPTTPQPYNVHMLSLEYRFARSGRFQVMATRSDPEGLVGTYEGRMDPANLTERYPEFGKYDAFLRIDRGIPCSIAGLMPVRSPETIFAPDPKKRKEKMGWLELQLAEGTTAGTSTASADSPAPAAEPAPESASTTPDNASPPTSSAAKLAASQASPKPRKPASPDTAPAKKKSPRKKKAE